MHNMLRKRLPTDPHGETLNCCKQGGPTHVAALSHPSVTVNEAIIHRRNNKYRNIIISVSGCASTYEHMANPMSVRVG